jgi:hypothetical protein
MREKRCPLFIAHSLFIWVLEKTKDEGKATKSGQNALEMKQQWGLKTCLGLC